MDPIARPPQSTTAAPSGAQPLPGIGYLFADPRAQALAQRARSFAGTELPAPGRAVVFTTPACNMTCVYCVSIHHAMPAWDLNRLRTLLTDLARRGTRHIQWTGGEASLLPGIVALVAHARSLGLTNSMSSNGTAPVATYEGLVHAGLSRFYLSLDSQDAAFFDWITGSQGRHADVLTTVAALAGLRPRFPDLWVTLNVAMTRTSVARLLARDGAPLREFLGWLDQLPVDDFKFVPASVEPFAGMFTDAAAQERWLALCREVVPATRQFFHFRLATLASGGHGFADARPRHCYQSLDDLAFDSVGAYGCVIQLREGGQRVFDHAHTPAQQAERLLAFLRSDRSQDPICRAHCFDIYQALNDRVAWLLEV